MGPLVRTTQLILAQAALLLAGAAGAQISTYGDWIIGCDNTHHCEAVGYAPQETESLPIALFIARDAGPGTEPDGQIMVESWEQAPAGVLTVRIGDFVLEDVREGGLSAPQFQALLPRMLEAREAVVSDGQHRWVLSLIGLKAALLKMDEVQGRIGTPGALLRTGNRPEASVPPPAPAPLLVPAPIVPTRPADLELLPALLAELEESDCAVEIPSERSPHAQLSRLSETRLLVLRECGRGAYQSGYGAWLTNDRPPYAPHRLSLPFEDGTQEDYLMNAHFNEGVLESYAKGRGIGDCISSAHWLWTESGFQLLRAEYGPVCRGILGGPPIRTWSATVKARDE